jgi:hypothetical protein
MADDQAGGARAAEDRAWALVQELIQRSADPGQAAR